MNAGGTTDSVTGGSAISLPKGGGAISGLGETFAADLCTGTGNLSIPIALPPGRHGVSPQLTLGYSTGNGGGPFGLGWTLSLPGVSRKTARGVPRYRDVDATDTFVLSGAEDLVRVSGAYPGRVRYRPRTEGLFARIEHVRDATGDYWEVRGTDGMLTRYGTVRPADAATGWRDDATTADPGPGGRSRVFGWHVTETADPLGNRIRFTYLRDQGDSDGHTWDRPLPRRISYADYGDPAAPSFLVSVEFEYEPRPDPCSEYRAGFEIRTSVRCRTVRVLTQAADGVTRTAREYRFGYQQAAFNGASLLTRIDVVGIDETGESRVEEHLPPLTFQYSGFDPRRRRFAPVRGAGLPVVPLSHPSLALVDLRGTGLPDLVELGAEQRYWSNRGDGQFDLPRAMAEAPPYALGEAGVRFLDANGDGRADLLAGSGYFPLTFHGGWSRRSFQPYRQLPSVSLADPEVKLIDLDGDGLTDILRSGTRLECWFNDPDPRLAWSRTAVARGPAPDIDLADPRVRLADMTGDGLQDIVLVRNGNVVYWPNLGHGRWGGQVQMRRAPRLPDGHDPRRLLLGDVDGDGAADLVYVDHGRVLVWGNQSGNGWTAEPVTINGTPDVVDTDDVQFADLHGTGMGGLLWSRADDGSGRGHLRFLDLTGGAKPYLLSGVDNGLGATTAVHYRPSTYDFLRDQAAAATRWRTTLPFPVQVVARVEVTDQISLGRLTTEYRYHHGHWDGLEREFRGFAMVEQLDTETSDTPGVHYSPPTLTKNWFHIGPVAAGEAGDWVELDLRHEYWDGDAPMLTRPADLTAFLNGLSRPARRDALRTLRGRLLRSELYGLDGTGRERRPYTVTESLSGVREEAPRVYFPFSLGQRTTQWERGDDPMTQFAFSAGYDAYGFATREVAVAVPRGRDPRRPDPGTPSPYLATYSTTEYARRDDALCYLIDRVARSTSYEVVNDGRLSVVDLRDTVFAGPTGGPVTLRLSGHARTYYDGQAFVGLPVGQLGQYGLPVRAESLAMTDDFLAGLPGFHRPYYLDPATGADDYPAEFLTLTPLLAGYVHYGETDVPGSPAGFYMSGARHRYDIHDVSGIPRGQVRASRDPLGAESRIDYDEHDLFPIRVTDAAGLSSYGSYDYRVLQAREAIDANGNSARVRFSPAGFVTEQFRCGKNGEGDVAAPSIRMEYDLLAFTRRGQPVSVRSILRVHHDAQTDVPADRRDEVIMAVEYSDGFGRSLQTRAQADDTVLGDPVFDGSMIPADQALPGWPSMGRTRPPGAADNVVASGWQIYDNKGRAVVTYEPFFATGFDYAPPVAAQLGQKATMSYDPRGQVIRTTNPDGSQQRVVFGVPVDLSDPDLFAPTPWEAFTYDANDNAGRTHGEAAATYRDHWDTPASVVFDALGRTVTAVARNGPVPDTDWFVTRSTYDIKGNLVAITDALGREAFRYAVDLVGRRWRVDGIDAGRRDTVTDALGRTVEGRDSKGALTLNAFDVLHRPIRVWARDDGSGPVTLRQRLDYGDGGDPNQPAAERNAARADNLLGLAVRHYDEAGLVTVARVDFKGNVVDATRRVIADASIVAAYELAAANGWQVTPFQVDWASGDGLLETTVYATTTAYDALNRISRLMLPRDVEGLRRTLHPTYNRAGGLVRVLLDDTVYLERIAYNAKGQRALVAYGNGVMTRYVYDPRTFRLARIRSEHYTVAGGDYQPSGEVIHDCGYSYDLAGNILAIHDRAPGSGIRANPGAFTSTDPILGSLLSTGDALERRFAYDPLYRLLSATGRECDASPVSDPWLDLPRCTDATRSRPYTESYVYDRTGSLLQLTHAAAAGFTRNFAVGSTSNRLVRMLVGATPFDYAFDANGNLRSESTSRHFAWNHADRLKAFATQTAGAEPSIHAHYLYDAAGIRVKKLVRRQGGGIEVTHYVGAMFEHHRWSGGSNSHVHVMDDSQRIAIVRIGPAHPSSLGPPIQFHLADHLGCSSAVIDDTGALTNREEFTPYGETSFGSFERKRFRFTGKERDEESGLNYHGARYLSPTLGRWFSCDPVVSAAGSSLYTYVNNRPLVRCDPTGNDEEDPKTTGGSAPKSERVSNPAGHNYGPTFWEAYSSGGRGRSGNLRYNALGPNQTFVRELMDKQWGCTLCHVSTVVWNEHGPKAFNSDNQLPVDSFIDRDGFASLVARSVVTRALTESFVGAVGLTQGMWATAGPVVQDIGNTAARTPAFDAPAPAPTGAPRPAFDVTMGDVKAIGDKKGLRHLSEMEGRGKYNDTGQTALVYYDREGGVVSTQIFSQRPPGGGPRTIVFEGTIGRVDIPAGLTPIQIGSRVEEPVRRVFSEWIGYEYPTKSPNAHGPDLHKPRGGQPTAPAPPRRGR